MDDKKRSAPGKIGSAHEELRRVLHEQLPARGDRTLTLTIDQVLGILSEYHYLKGQVEGLLSGGILLKNLLEKR